MRDPTLDAARAEWLWKRAQRRPVNSNGRRKDLKEAAWLLGPVLRYAKAHGVDLADTNAPAIAVLAARMAGEQRDAARDRLASKVAPSQILL